MSNGVHERIASIYRDESRRVAACSYGAIQDPAASGEKADDFVLQHRGVRKGER